MGSELAGAGLVRADARLTLRAAAPLRELQLAVEQARAGHVTVTRRPRELRVPPSIAVTRRVTTRLALNESCRLAAAKTHTINNRPPTLSMRARITLAA